MKEIKKNNKKKANDRKALGNFLKEHIITKTKVLTIIGIILAILVVSIFITANVKMTDENTTFEKTSIAAVLKDRIISLLLILLAGWVPYFYIPVVAYAAYVFMLAGDLAFYMELNGTIRTLVINCVPALVDIFTVGIIAAIGIYVCKYATKKYRYRQKTSFSFLDVKIQLYQMTKKQDKYEETVAKKEQRIADIQENDVKIDYKMIFKITSIIIVINLLVALIQHVIN